MDTGFSENLEKNGVGGLHTGKQQATQLHIPE